MVYPVPSPVGLFSVNLVKGNIGNGPVVNGYDGIGPFSPVAGQTDAAGIDDPQVRLPLDEAAVSMAEDDEISMLLVS